MKFFFNKKHRLTTTRDFNYVLNFPNVVKCREIVILGRVNSLSFARLGISISRKNIRYSYQRNKMKRLIREKFRIIQYRLLHLDFVVIVKACSVQMEFKSLVQELENLWSHYYQ